MDGHRRFSIEPLCQVLSDKSVVSQVVSLPVTRSRANHGEVRILVVVRSRKILDVIIPCVINYYMYDVIMF